MRVDAAKLLGQHLNHAFEGIFVVSALGIEPRTY